jgi:hypothetical protein
MATMSTATYDPFAIERHKVKIGELGEWTVADATDDIIAKVDACEKKLAKLGQRKTAKVADFAAAVGELCEVACDDAEGLGALIESVCDPEAAKAAGRKPIGLQGLLGLARHIFDWYSAEALAGND